MRDQFQTNEGLREFLHIVFGLFRLVGRRVARHERGWDWGIVLYPAAVLALILIFNWHIEIAAVAWVIMAFGDGFATLIGRAVPLSRLPWNAEKSVGGSLAFLLFGGGAAFAIARFFGGPAYTAVAIAIVTAAIAESLPLRLNDNV